jgi:hypothetical protein
VSSGKIDNSLNDPFDLDGAGDQIGKTSAELPKDALAAQEVEEAKRKNLFSDFSLFDAMLLLSLIFVTAATLRVFFALGAYGGYFWDYPWRIEY